MHFGRWPHGGGEGFTFGALHDLLEPGWSSYATVGRELASEVILKTGCTGASGDESAGTISTFSDALDSGWPVHASGPETATDDVEAMLDDLIESAQRAFPTFRVPIDVFAAYLQDRLPADVPRCVALRQLHTSDLYLACGCARGDAGAIAAFDDHCVRPLDRVLGKMRIAPEACADVKQDIRVRILVGTTRGPEILAFSGRGDLRGWVRVMAVRQAVQRQCRGRREVAVSDDELLERVVVSGAPELDHTKRKYREEFKRAFEAALRALPDRERTLLHQHHVDGLTIDEIGALYRVHRSTAARLLTRVRVVLLDATRLRMMSELGVAPDDLDSIIRLIRSQIEISLHGLHRRRRR